MTTTLSYCVKHSRQRPLWRGPIPWDGPEPEIGGTITIDDVDYRVLDAGATDHWEGREQRHISAYVIREAHDD